MSQWVRFIVLPLSLAGTSLSIFVAFAVWSASKEVTLLPDVAEEETPRASEHAAPKETVPKKESNHLAVEEIYVNVNSREMKIHYVKLLPFIEVFESKDLGFLEERKAGVKHVILETSREQEFEQLSTLPGKLYFKELLVSRLNQYLNQPMIRDIHFSTFNLQ